MIELPKVIASSEEIGRGIFDSKKARQARAGKIPPKVFREKNGTQELSVDRLSFGGHAELTAVHDTERAGQDFHGWATLSARDATKNGRTIHARPITPINPYHAEIVLPASSEAESADDQDQHALNLAMMAKWLSRPAAA